MLAALQATDGRPMASSPARWPTRSQALRRHSPIYIDVTTEKRYAQGGCSRLKVTFWQDGVLLPARGPRRQTMDFGINYCLDGRPPQSLEGRSRMKLPPFPHLSVRLLLAFTSMLAPARDRPGCAIALLVRPLARLAFL